MQAENRCLVQLPPKVNYIMCRWSGYCFSPAGLVKKKKKSWVPIEIGRLPLTAVIRCGKEGIFLARARHATVIQMKLNYSSVGPRLLCDHICCCAGTFKLGHFPLQFLSHSQFAPCIKPTECASQSHQRPTFAVWRFPKFGALKETNKNKTTYAYWWPHLQT